MEEINTILAYEDSLKIIQRKDSFRFSIDSTILSFFVQIKKTTGQIIDLGSGSGAIPLFLSMFTTKPIYGIEIQESVFELSKRSVELNHLENQISIINGDIREIDRYFKKDSFGLVVSNPPYFKVHSESFKNADESVSISRHEVKITLEEIIEAGKYLLKDGGSLCIIQATDRFMETIDLLKKHGFAVKRLRFVYPTTSKESNVFMVDAMKNQKDQGLKILPPLYIYNESNDYSSEILSYFHYGEKNEEK